jgi:hypothetical protein
MYGFLNALCTSPPPCYFGRSLYPATFRTDPSVCDLTMEDQISINEKTGDNCEPIFAMQVSHFECWSVKHTHINQITLPNLILPYQTQGEI